MTEASPIATLPRRRRISDPLFWLLSGQFVSRVGDALLSVASVWLVLDLTDNNPVAASVAVTFEFLPFLLFGLVAGVLVDRWDRRRLMVASDAARAAVVLAVPLLASAGRLEVWHLLAVNFTLSSIGRLFTPARQAMMPDLVEPDRLVRANALAEGTGQAAWILGPALGGVLLAWAGAVNVYYLDAASFAISALSLLLVRVQSATDNNPAAGTSLWAEAAGGIRYVRQHALIGPVLLTGMAATAAFAPVPALLPVLVRTDLHAGARVLGMVMTCFFLGSVAASMLLARWGARLCRGWALTGGVVGVGLGAAALARSPSAIAAATALAVIGAGASAFNVAEYSLLQAETPAALRGRVFAVAGVTAQALRPAALLSAGMLAGAAGARTAIGAMAVLALATTAFALTRRELRGCQ